MRSTNLPQPSEPLSQRESVEIAKEKLLPKKFIDNRKFKKSHSENRNNKEKSLSKRKDNIDLTVRFTAGAQSTLTSQQLIRY